MGLTRHRATGLAWWTIGLVLASACAKGTLLDESTGGVSGAGGNAGGGAPTSSAAKGAASSGATSDANGASSSANGASSSANGASSSVNGASSSIAASSGSGTGCNFDEHICNGVCIGNTIGTGCYLSATCMPCPTPTHGAALCTANGTCDVICDAGYTPNATKTDCDPPPPPPMCCDDSECAIFTICLDGYCRNPLASACDPARCTEFCKCQAGGTPQSTGQCKFNVFVWECNCTP